MPRAVKNGWDFIKVAEIYQYKEAGLIIMVTILEDKSTDEEYNFTVAVLDYPGYEDMTKMFNTETFTVSHTKEFDGMYSDMTQFYPADKVEYAPHSEIREICDLGVEKFEELRKKRNEEALVKWKDRFVFKT
jgi:hypothetical protein